MVKQILSTTALINGVPKVQKTFSWLPFTFPVEKTFEQERMLEWFKQNWHTSIYWCAFYLFIIYVGRVNNMFGDLFNE